MVEDARVGPGDEAPEEFWSVSRLERAFGRVARVAPAAAAVPAAGRLAILRCLAHELGRGGAVAPAETLTDADRTRAYVVTAVISDALGAVQAPTRPPATARWVTDAAESGLTAATALDARHAFVNADMPRTLAAISGDATGPVVANAGMVAAALRDNEPVVSAILADRVYAGVDAVLARAALFGRDRATGAAHLVAARLGHEVVVMCDHTPGYEWLLPATVRQIYAELARLGLDASAVREQSLDLARGGELNVFGHSVRRSRGRLGGAGFRSEACEPAAPTRLPSDGPPSAATPSETAGRRRTRQPSTGRLVATAAWCLRWLHATKVNARAVRAARPTRLAAPRVGVRALVIGACVTASTAFFATAYAEIRSGLSSEAPVAGAPAGFYAGVWNQGTVFSPDPVEYGLYLPPAGGRSGGERGQPLLVFLHGYLPTEQSLARVLKVGLPRSVEKVASPGRAGFPMAVLMPLDLDSSGNWPAESRAVESLPGLVAHVVRRHNVDASRVYLTGLSNGARAAWEAVERHPHLWAAVAPVSSPYVPNAEAVKATPVWSFVGESDQAVDTGFVERLKRLGADARQTVYPKRGHDVWREAYDDPALYEWLASRRLQLQAR